MTISQQSTKALFWYAIAAYSTVLLIKSLFFVVHPESLSAIPPLWNGDGGLYGFYAKQLLLQQTLPYDAEYMPAHLLEFIVNSFHISLDKALFFTPLFLSCLSVIPVLLIGYAYKKMHFAFVVSIVGSLSHIYFIRSFAGYYDTDMLNVTLSLLIVSFLILYVEKKSFVFLLLAIASATVFYFWYHQSSAIIFAIFVNFMLYLLFDAKKYMAIVLLLLSGLFILYVTGIYLRFLDYFFQNNVLQTINEAKPMELENMAYYFSLPQWYFWLACGALVVFYVKHKSFWLTLPLLFIALLSLKAGTRFSEYGVLVFAFGVVTLLDVFKRKVFLHYSAYVLLIFYTVFLSYQTTKQLKPLLNKAAVVSLRAQDTNLTKEDMILTWWDYGWSLWYYTKAQTYIDNAKHFEGNTDIANLLFMPQKDLNTAITTLFPHHKAAIYFMFHERMITILPTIASFAKPSPFLKRLSLKHSIINLKQKSILYHQQKIYLKHIYLIGAGVTEIHPNMTANNAAKKSLIVYKNKYAFLVDKKSLNSFFIQAYLLTNHANIMFLKFKIKRKLNEND